MKSWRCTNLLIALACAPGLMAADWLPLETGNQWVYRGSGEFATSPLVVRVGESREFAGHSYYELKGLAERPCWLRNDGDRVFVWDTNTGQESLWLDFSHKAGESYTSMRRGQSDTTIVKDIQMRVTTSAGDFSDATSFAYGTMLIGDLSSPFLIGETLAPGVGVLIQEFTRPNGIPTRYELVYARLGSSTVLKGPENGIQLSLNEDKTWARLQSDQTNGLKTLRLYDETGGEIWSASIAGKFFPAVGDLNAALPELKAGRYVITGECGDARISLPFTVE